MVELLLEYNSYEYTMDKKQNVCTTVRLVEDFENEIRLYM